jgi:hypothetical protein
MSDRLADSSFFYNNALGFIHYFGWISIFVVILFIAGVLTDEPSSFLAVNFIVKVCMALYLIYRFNDYRKDKVVFTDLDRKICYSVGVYIVIFSFFDVIQLYVERLRELVNPYTVFIKNSINHVL